MDVSYIKVVRFLTEDHAKRFYDLLRKNHFYPSLFDDPLCVTCDFYTKEDYDKMINKMNYILRTEFK